MSIYYNHKENLSHKNHHDVNQGWENIEHITNHPLKDQSNLRQKNKLEKQSLHHKNDKLLIQQERQVASGSSSEPNQDQDELQFSTSTVQSNDRRKYKSFQRDSDQWQPKSKKKKKNRKIGEEQELKSKQKMKKVEKTKPKYLFYNIVKEQKPLLSNNQQRDTAKTQVKKKQVGKNKSPSHQQLNTIQDYKYQKGLHPQKQHKKERLKNKLGFIFDLFHRKQQVASVSYYSESHKQSVSSIQLKKEETNPNNNENIFNYNNLVAQQEMMHNGNQDAKTTPKQLLKSNAFQVLNLPARQFQNPNNKQVELGIHSNKKNEVRIDKEELQRSMLNKSKINTQKGKSKMQLTKSLQNKPKNTRYDEFCELDQANKEGKSIEISRHIGYNKASDKKESQVRQSLSKSISQDSKLSIKMIEVKKASSQHGKEAEKSHQIKQSVHQYENKKQNKEDDVQYQETTVKKKFPIARNILDSKKNLFSKYMKINYKQSDQSKEQSVDEQIPSVFVRNTNNMSNNSRTRPIDQKNNDLKQAQTNSNTGEISIKPLNKIQFTIERSKRIKPQLIQPKDNLTDQERKFLNLLKKREEALLRRVKQQVITNNPNSILKDNYQQRGKNLSNNDFERLMSQQDNSLMLKSPAKSYKNGERRDKLSLKTQPQAEPKQFPTLNSLPYNKQAKFETFYNNSPIKRTSSKNLNYLSSKAKKGFSEHLSNDSQKKGEQDRFDELKGFKRQPSKISYYNSKKLHNEFSLKDRLNLNSKEKYDRLKQLLHQI